MAWKEGKRLLERLIAERIDYALQTTLGGNSIVSLLEEAASKERIEVLIWYVGLSSPELHIARVRARVARGGHDIPEEKIRERYTQSVFNSTRLMPHVAELFIYHNSEDADPHTGKEPHNPPNFLG